MEAPDTCVSLRIIIVLKSFRNLFGEAFLRNVVTLASGTMAAQIITILATPFITRLYGPEAYGIHGLFLSLTSIFATVAALTYPTAIVLPKNDSDAIGLVKISVVSSISVALLAAIALIFFGPRLLSIVNAQTLGVYIYLLPIMVVVSSLTAILGQWMIRKKAYRTSAVYEVYTALVVSSVKAVAGIIHPSPLVLIVTTVSGGLLGLVLTFRGWLGSRVRESLQFDEHKEKRLIDLAAEYKDFPLLRMPQNAINGISQSLPVIMLAAYFGTGSSGQYSLAILALGLPAKLIGGSIMSVFYPLIADVVRSGTNAREMIVKATLGMAILGIIPYLVIVALGPFLFGFAFGDEWRVSGEYAQWLAPWIFLQFVNRPAVAAVAPLRLQGGLLLYELFSTGTKVIAVWIGFAVFSDALISVALFAVFGVIAYLWLILWVIWRSGKMFRLDARG